MTASPRQIHRELAQESEWERVSDSEMEHVNKMEPTDLCNSVATTTTHRSVDSGIVRISILPDLSLRGTKQRATAYLVKATLLVVALVSAGMAGFGFQVARDSNPDFFLCAPLIITFLGLIAVYITILLVRFGRKEARALFSRRYIFVAAYGFLLATRLALNNMAIEQVNASLVLVTEKTQLFWGLVLNICVKRKAPEPLQCTLVSAVLIGSLVYMYNSTDKLSLPSLVPLFQMGMSAIFAALGDAQEPRARANARKGVRRALKVRKSERAKRAHFKHSASCAGAEKIRFLVWLHIYCVFTFVGILFFMDSERVLQLGLFHQWDWKVFTFGCLPLLVAGCNRIPCIMANGATATQQALSFDMVVSYFAEVLVGLSTLTFMNCTMLFVLLALLLVLYKELGRQRKVPRSTVTKTCSSPTKKGRQSLPSPKAPGQTQRDNSGEQPSDILPAARMVEANVSVPSSFVRVD